MFRHPAIQEACVIADEGRLPRRDRSRPWSCCAPTHKDTTEQEIIDWCRENMAVYKIPRSVQFVDALPKSGSGKVMWRLLQEAEASR